MQIFSQRKRRVKRQLRAQEKQFYNPNSEMGMAVMRQLFLLGSFTYYKLTAAVRAYFSLKHKQFIIYVCSLF